MSACVASKSSPGVVRADMRGKLFDVVGFFEEASPEERPPPYDIHRIHLPSHDCSGPRFVAADQRWSVNVTPPMGRCT